MLNPLTTLWVMMGILLGIFLGRRRYRILGWLCKGLAGLGCLVLIAVAIRYVIVRQREFADPCMEWGVHSYTSRMLSTRPDPRNPCSSRGAETSETRAHAAWGVLRYGAGLFLAGWLGLSGILRGKRWMTLDGAVISFAFVPQLVMSIIMPVAWLTAIGLLAVSLQRGDAMGDARLR